MKTQLKCINGTLIDESDTLTFKELVVENKANLDGANLTVANLAGANLTWADLIEADLTGADLTWANLTEASLTGADLTGANIDYSAWPLWCGTYNVKVEKHRRANRDAFLLD